MKCHTDSTGFMRLEIALCLVFSRQSAPFVHRDEGSVVLIY